jgi:type I restriction-modification system DNA methylase subunit
MNNTTTGTWLSFMHSLHNTVRTGRKVTLTGLGALNEINNYLLLFFIEREFPTYKLDDDCRFSHLYFNYCTDSKIAEDKKINWSDKNALLSSNYYKLWNHWCNTGKNPNCVLRKLANNNIIKKYLKNEVMSICAYVDEPDTGNNIQTMINSIWKTFSDIAYSDKNYDRPNDKERLKYRDTVISLSLDTFGFDAFGDAYERFKQQVSKDSGKTTGQHFTPDVVKKYIMSIIKPRSNEIFYEPACGTGGFIHHSKKYVKENEGEKASVLFASKINANECNPEIYKPLAINMLIHGIPIENIRKQDSLDNDWIEQTKEMFDGVVGNPPFGPGGKLMLSPYWSVLKTGNNVIKESFMAQFLIHIFHSLKNGGRCGTVSDRGVLNNGTDGKNSWQTRFRKFFLENVNLHTITLLPDDTFDYTNFSTCCLFFVKGEPTKQIEFRELTFKNVTVDGQTNREIDTDVSLGYVSIEMIKAKNYSLKADDYFKVVKPKEDTSGWIKLGEVCDTLTKSKHKAGNALDDGEYNFYTSSRVIKKSNFNDYKNDTIIIGSGGNGSLFIDENFSCSADNFILKINNSNIKYIYYYLKINFNKLY